MRDFKIVVPPDCTASEDAEENRRVLRHMARVLKAAIVPAEQIAFADTGVLLPAQTVS
jgi:hypothetical protein